MSENISLYLKRPVEFIKSTVYQHKHSLILGLSSSLTAGAAYSYIVSLDYSYFTPALGIIAGLLGGLGIAARDIFSEKESFEDVPLKDLAAYILFGITGLLLGYIFVYSFVKFPDPAQHGGFFLPSEQGTILDFFERTLKLHDILGAVFGSICSSAIPILFKKKINNLIKKLKISQFYPASK